MSKRSGSYPITKGGRVEGFRQRGSKKAASKKAPSRTRVKVRQKISLPKVPETIEVAYPNEGLGFFEAWDAEEFSLWAEKAKKTLAKTVPIKEVESLWRSIPSEEMAIVDGDRYPVITYADGETFIVDVEDALKKAKAGTLYKCPDCGSTIRTRAWRIRCSSCGSLNLERQLPSGAWKKADAYDVEDDRTPPSHDIEDHVWERCDVCSRRTHPNEIELYKGICADCANADEED